MENFIKELVKNKATGSFLTVRDGSNSDRCLIESACLSCGCVLTEWYEHECGSIVMDFQADHGHFIIVAEG
jgi:hypothetical protein